MTPDEPGTDAISVWLRRVGPVIDLVGKLGLTTVLILIVALCVGWATGYLPLKPFDDQRADHTAINAAVLKQAEALDKMAVLLARMDRRAQLIDCARLNDPDLRKRCLE